MGRRVTESQKSKAMNERKKITRKQKIIHSFQEENIGNEGGAFREKLL